MLTPALDRRRRRLVLRRPDNRTSTVDILIDWIQYLNLGRRRPGGYDTADMHDRLDGARPRSHPRSPATSGTSRIPASSCTIRGTIRPTAWTRRRHVRSRVPHERNEQTRHRRLPRNAAAPHRRGRREERHHRQGQAGALPGRVPRAVDRPQPGDLAAGLDPAKFPSCSRSPTRPRPRSCRRAATPGWSAGKSRTTARSCCRSTAWTRSARSIRSPTPSRSRPASRLQRTREAAAAVDRLYPQLLPSEGSCTIGGNLSTNAGGTAALAHGIARSHALGLEVVLADGRIMQQPQQAEEGQHRLRPARSVHRRRRHARHHHRGVAAPRAAAALGRDRLGRDPFGAGRGRSARARHRAHRRRRDELRDHGARGHRHRHQASAARAIRWRRPRPIRC